MNFTKNNIQGGLPYGVRPFLCTQYVKYFDFYITLLAFTYTMRIKQ